MSNKNENVHYKKSVFKETKEHVLETQLNLPDYFPDVCRILTCQVKPYVETCRSDGERINVDGTTTIRLLYCDEDKRMHLYEAEMRYSKSVVPPNFADSYILDCKQKAVNISYRAIGPRRVDVKATVSITVEASEIQKLDMVTDFAVGIERLVREYDLFDISACYSGSFMIEESFTPRDDRISESKMLQDSANVYATEIKTVKDKILIKGYAELNINYFYPKEQIVFKYTESVPFSQIVDIYGLSETDKCNVIMNPQKLTLSLKDSGECTLNLVVSAAVCAGNLKSVAVTQDLYATDFTASAHYSHALPFVNLRTITDSFLCSTQNEKNDSTEVQILSVYETDISQTAEIKDGKIKISGQLSFSALLCADGDFKLINRTIHFDYAKDTDIAESGELHCNLICKSIVCNKSAQGIVFKAEIEIAGYYMQSQQIRYITKYDLDEKCSHASDCELITLYFAESGESVWDIAKNNKVPVQLLKDTNSLTDDVIESEKVLVLIGK